MALDLVDIFSQKGDVQSQGYHLPYMKPYEIYCNPYASIPSASGFRVGKTGAFSHLFTGYLEH